MNRQETVALTRYVKACCPQQAIDEYTPDAWHDLLGDLDLDACRQAAARVVRRQSFVSLPRTALKSIRNVRNGLPSVAPIASCRMAKRQITSMNTCGRPASGLGLSPQVPSPSGLDLCRDPSRPSHRRLSGAPDRGQAIPQAEGRRQVACSVPVMCARTGCCPDVLLVAASAKPGLCAWS